jgi:hypothetical protein
VAAPEPTSVGRRGPELRNTWQRWSSPLGEADPGVMGHVAASEPRRGPELRNTWQRRISLLGETEPGAMGHVVAPEPTLVGSATSETEKHVATSELNSTRR